MKGQHSQQLGGWKHQPGEGDLVGAPNLLSPRPITRIHEFSPSHSLLATCLGWGNPYKEMHSDITPKDSPLWPRSDDSR